MISPIKRSFGEILCIGLVCSGLLAACGSAPINPRLESARAAYAQAKDNKDVVATPTAQVHLNMAKEALSAASKAEEPADVEKHAFKAEKEVQIAVEISKRKAAEKEVEALDKKKQDMLMMAREKEAAKAKAEAEKAQALAEAKAREAEAKAREAEARAREAEMATERAEREAARARELEKQLQELQAKQTERGLVLTLGDVLFETGKANLLPGAARNLDKLAEFLQQNPERKILIEGHTDSVGSAEYNMTLSESRSASVRGALLDRGINSARMSTQGFGKSKPVADNSTAGGRQQNRRVEIIILD